MVIVVSLFFLAVIAIQAPVLVRSRMWRELIAFGSLMAAAITYSFDLMLNWDLPSIRDVVEIVFIPVTEFLEKVIS